MGIMVSLIHIARLFQKVSTVSQIMVIEDDNNRRTTEEAV